ncbi:GNAT family N-acetyltransferase [Acinetobacter baumannii]|uniref:GNAT family N-acetyltransferase n=1 Tax=Acinetobacter baumannii TaxID=470 RepID=UPI000847E3F6|nr:GNAT family N-acetyltransferase [Acinetobacter baumannii]AOM85154.1 acetyltransferase [Acinetobacter baumannii]MDC5332584.1 GNAT family N-acetyltransferase [Acinetobacter baumannii]
MTLNTVTLSTQRLILKPFTANDADETYNCITPTLTRYMAWDPQPRHEFDQTWSNWLKNFALGTEIIFVIRETSSQVFIGLVGLHRIQTSNPELGIWIREDYHYHGYGREAVTAVAKWAIDFVKPDFFVYPVAEDNYPSRKIAESLGGKVVSKFTGPKYELVTYEIPVSF